MEGRMVGGYRRRLQNTNVRRFLWKHSYKVLKRTAEDRKKRKHEKESAKNLMASRQLKKEEVYMPLNKLWYNKMHAAERCTIFESCLFSALKDVCTSFSWWKRLDFLACNRWFSLTISAQVCFESVLPCASAVSRWMVCCSTAISSVRRVADCCSAVNCFVKLCKRQQTHHTALHYQCQVHYRTTCQCQVHYRTTWVSQWRKSLFTVTTISLQHQTNLQIQRDKN